MDDGQINTIDGILLHFTMAVDARATSVASTADNGDTMHSRADKRQRGQYEALRPGKVLMPYSGDREVLRSPTGDSKAAPPRGKVSQPLQYNVARDSKEPARDGGNDAARFTHSGNGGTMCAHGGESLRKCCTKPGNPKNTQPGAKPNVPPSTT